MAIRVALSAIALALLACAAPAATPAGEPPGSSGLIDQTSVGKHRCPTDDGEIRPFVVEWDATDLSDFEARAARDIVFVKYAGCREAGKVLLRRFYETEMGIQSNAVDSMVGSQEKVHCQK